MSSARNTKVGVVWFKRDLRVSDHKPLAEATRRCSGGVVGLYIYEPIVMQAEEHDARHLAFINDCLSELRAQIRRRGSELLLASGDAVEVLERLRRAIGFTELLSHEETGLRATFDRDLAVAEWARKSGVAWTEYPQHGVIRPLTSRDGWARKWQARMAEETADTPDVIPSVEGTSLEAFGSVGLCQPVIAAPSSIQVGGSGEAERVLNSFLYRRGQLYQSEMSSPLAGAEACSRISTHLAYGSLSIRTALRAAQGRSRSLNGDRGAEAADWRRSIASFEKRLRWHCHFIQKLEDEPEIEHRNFNRAYDNMRTERHADWSASEAARFESFVSATTGYPFIDACLRCLHETGWINFRMRAMLMSFASYHLWLHWKQPAIHLARLFTDFEPGIHYSQCQMQSGVTGINTIRIYSPIKQQIDQDPTGEFVRHWIPELEGVPDEYLAEPHTMPGMTQHMAGCVIGEHYPEPIVDHKLAYADAKRRIFEHRNTPEAREESQRVYLKHGSRQRPSRHRSGSRPQDDRREETKRNEH